MSVDIGKTRRPVPTQRPRQRTDLQL